MYVPASDALWVCVDIDGEVEKVGYEDLSAIKVGGGVDLQDVYSLYDEDIGLVDDVVLVGDHVVVEV